MTGHQRGDSRKAAAERAVEAQHLADDPTAADDWLARVVADAKAEAVESMAHLFRDMANETIARRRVIQLLHLRAESYRIARGDA